MSGHTMEYSPDASKQTLLKQARGRQLSLLTVPTGSRGGYPCLVTKEKRCEPKKYSDSCAEPCAGLGSCAADATGGRDPTGGIRRWARCGALVRSSDRRRRRRPGFLCRSFRLANRAHFFGRLCCHEQRPAHGRHHPNRQVRSRGQRVNLAGGCGGV